MRMQSRVPLTGSTPVRILCACILAGLPLLLVLPANGTDGSQPAWFWPAILASIGTVALLATLADHCSRINLCLTAEVARHEQVQQALAEANEHLSGQLAEIMSLRDQLREQMVHDPLTGLYNRRFLEEVLDTEVARPAGLGIRSASSCSIWTTSSGSTPRTVTSAATRRSSRRQSAGEQCPHRRRRLSIRRR